jgi:hypothetical protein
MDQIRFERQADRIAILINGKKKHQLESLLDSIVTYTHPVGKSLRRHQKFTDARIIDSGFCVEDCCPSTWARMDISESHIKLHAPHTSIKVQCPEEIEDDFCYVFEKAQFLEEANTLLTADLYGVTEAFARYQAAHRKTAGSRDRPR